MPAEYAVDGLAVPESLSDLHELLERVGRENPDVPAQDLTMFETAVIEVAGNVVQHGRPPGQVRYSFELTVLPDRVEARLTEAGEQEVAGDPRHATLPGPLAEGGRGLALTRAVLDDFSYDRIEGQNVWTMVRQRH